MSLLTPSTLTALRAELRVSGWSSEAISDLLRDLALQEPGTVPAMRAAFGAVTPEWYSERDRPDGLLPRTEVLVVCWNGRKSVLQTVQEVRAEVPDAAILLVDAGSTDGTAELLRALAGSGLPWLRTWAPGLPLPGYAAAMATGLSLCRAEILLRQDLLPFSDPCDLSALRRCLLEQEAAVVFRTRRGSRRVPRTSEAVGRWICSGLFSLASGLALGDPAAGFGALRRAMVNQPVPFTASPLSVDLAIGSRAARRRLRVCELPVERAGVPVTPATSVLDTAAALGRYAFRRSEPRAVRREPHTPAGHPDELLLSFGEPWDR